MLLRPGMGVVSGLGQGYIVFVHLLGVSRLLNSNTPVAQHLSGNFKLLRIDEAPFNSALQ